MYCSVDYPQNYNIIQNVLNSFRDTSQSHFEFSDIFIENICLNNYTLTEIANLLNTIFANFLPLPAAHLDKF